MKRLALLVLIICVAFSAACAAPPTYTTPVGTFEFSQDTMPSIEDEQGNSLTAAQGNTLLVVYMTPEKDSTMTEDQAYSYFLNGTQAAVEGQTYDLKCISLEKVDGKLRYGLVFEITDNGYDNKQPNVTLRLPESAPAISPAISPEASAAAAPSPTAIATTNTEATSTVTP